MDDHRNIQPFDIHDMDIHALDMEDLNIDLVDEIAINASVDNFTYPTYNNTWIFGPTQDQIIIPMLLSIIALCAVISNGLIVFSILGFKHMRTGPNLMFLNIAVSDMILIFFCIPTSIVNHAIPNGGGPLTVSLCKFVHYVTFVTVYVGIYTLVVICVFRFFSEVMSSKFGTLLSRGNALTSSVVIWAAFLISHVNLLLQEDAALFQEPFICIQSDLLVSQTKMRTLWGTFLTCAFLLPLVTVCGLSAIILHSHNHKMPIEDSYEIHDKVDVHHRRELTVLTMASMVMRTVCWLPIQIFVMIDVFQMTEITIMYRKAEMVGACCAFLGASISALVYNIVSMDFRMAFHESAAVLTCKKQEDSPGYTDDGSDMNETIMSILSDSSNHINYA